LLGSILKGKTPVAVETAPLTDFNHDFSYFALLFSARPFTLVSGQGGVSGITLGFLSKL